MLNFVSLPLPGFRDFIVAISPRVIVIYVFCPLLPILSPSALNMLCVAIGGFVGAIANDKIWRGLYARL